MRTWLQIVRTRYKVDMNQRGFGLIIYAVLALGILGTLAGIGYSIRKAGADAVRAELQPKLDECAAAVQRQNDAIARLHEEAAKKQAAAAQALAKASQKARVWEDNAARLRAVLTAPRKAGEAAPTSCEAAWKEIRK